ncbi:MAG: glycosyltransferase family 2 protein [Bdellovibrionales bacterium]|nr:glycosyltransferase family 2 protein [Bdellovibrionales bacterium]
MAEFTDLTVVIPALNEARTIASVIEANLRIAGSVVIVDDGSTDGTGEIARKSGATVVRNDEPTGYDAAIAAGMNRAFEQGAVAVVTCDADGQHRGEDVREVSAKVLREGYDYCAGVRDHYNRPIEAVLGLVSRPLFGTRDPFCGLRCYSRKIYEKFGPFPPQLNVGTLPMLWIQSSGLRGTFLPIRMEKRADHPRFARRIRANWLLFSAFARTTGAYLTGGRRS